MTKQQRALINIEYKVAKPFVDATALGLAIGGPSAFSGNFWGGFVCGTSFSFSWYWISNNLTRPKKSKAKRRQGVGPETITVNSAGGSREVRLGRTFEFAPYQPVHVSRETFWGTLRRLVMGAPEPRPVIDKLHVLREFVFQSHYEGQPVEIREDDLRRFLRIAWKYRFRGQGISNRHWVIEWRQRPQWYKDLGPHWYRAVLILLREAQQVRKRQLIVCIGPQWYALARDPHITLGLLREAEKLKGNVQPDIPNIPQADELIIGTDGVSSFEV